MNPIILDSHEYNRPKVEHGRLLAAYGMVYYNAAVTEDDIRHLRPAQEYQVTQDDYLNGVMEWR